MSKPNRNLKALGEIIKRLEDDSAFIDMLEIFLNSKTKSNSLQRIHLSEFDVFDEFSKNGREELSMRLESLSEEQLKSIIREHNLDSKKLAQKWKNKERLVTLILDRVETKSTKGDVFLKFGEKK